MLDYQETFDKVATHLLTQNERAMRDDRVIDPESLYYDPDNNCAYFNEDGLKCAVGCLIPEDKYSPDIEGKGVHGVNTVCNMGWVYDDISFLCDLQTIHDETPVDMWPDALKTFARDRDLNYNVLAKFQ